MLIYNYQKEFLGIDENDLKSLGFSNFAHLRNEAADFADFFVKTPGFVHNFKHVHWIDFVTCAEGSEDSKVIIHANGKNYRCTLDIRVAYLIDNPTQKAYLIHLMNLRALTHSENEQIAGDILERPALKGANEVKAIFGTPEFINDNDFKDKEEIDSNGLDNKSYLSNDPYETTVEETYYDDSPIDLGDDFLVNQEEEIEKVEERVEPVTTQTTTQKEIKKVQTPTQVLDVGSDYVYDPHLASDELGLPVDLIEEFIQDFISQANEFKDELYNSLRDDNIANLKILSHKLKGVAANLRVEDALEVLTTINTSEDTEIIEINLNTFYIIIDRLAGKSSQAQEEVKEEKDIEEESAQDDDIVLSFKDDVEVIEKVNEVPDVIVEAPVFEDEVSENVFNVEEKIEIPSSIDKEIELDYDAFMDKDDFDKNDVSQESMVVLEPEVEQISEDIEPELKPETEQIPEVIESEVQPKVEQIPEVIEFEVQPNVEQIPEVIESEMEQTFEDVEPESKEFVEDALESKTKTEKISSRSNLEYENLSYDKVLVANEIGISLEVFNELFEDYISEASKACNDIGIAIENNDTSSWQKSAIKLKGMSDNMRVHDIVAELKSIIHTSDVDIAKKAVGIVASKLQQISKTEV